MEHRKWEIWPSLASFLVCLGMAVSPRPLVGAGATAEDSRIAVLENRSDQIDSHLRTTDDSVQRLWNMAEAEGNDIAEMKGEERAAFAVLTILTGMNLLVVGKRKTGNTP